VTSFDLQLRTRVVFGVDSVERIGQIAGELQFRHVLVVSDAGLVKIGLADRIERLLVDAGLLVSRFHDFSENPDTVMVERGRAFAAAAETDAIVALGGGSSLDCAKGINFVLTNGGTMRDYQGHGKAALPMQPMIAVPTTAGTGSEAQQYALISDAETHEKMACGDPKACFRVAILDPALTVSQPRDVTAVVGMDAMSHAVESFVTTRRTSASDLFAKQAWQLLSANYLRVLRAPEDVEARGAMLLGAHLAGVAIEQSMLGATHACANPLTARFGTRHGVAIGVMLPHVVRWNGAVVEDRYAELIGPASPTSRAVAFPPALASVRLARTIEALRDVAGLAASLSDLGVEVEAIDDLADMAATQWTGTFNPRPFDAAGARELYARAGGW
jgi:alcohol dehydrogenase